MTVASAWTEPVAMSTVFSCDDVKKPTARLSLDQNGDCAPSVRGMGRAVAESRARTQSAA
jgi:hypothetical protein